MRVLSVALVCLVAGCGGGESGTPMTPATHGGASGVVAAVTLSPDGTTIHVDDTLQFSATLKDANGAAVAGKTIAWSTSSAAVATIASSGLLTAVGEGSVIVSATVDGVSGKATIMVGAARTVASIALDVAAPTLARGQTLELTPVLRDAGGAIIPRRVVSWTSSDPTIAQPTARGATTTVLAGLAGATTVTATVDGVTAKATVSVVAIAKIAAGSQFSCALSTEARLYCAGLGYGPLAKPLAPDKRFVSVTVDGIGVDGHGCAIASDGSSYCWGANANGELGVGDSASRVEPTRVAGGLTFASISVGRFHTCAVTTQGDPYCWGSGSEGRLGAGDTISRPVPTRVIGGMRFNQIQAGANATCGVEISGQAYCWGRNDLGQLGNNGVVGGNLGDFVPTPVPVSSAASTAQIVTKGPRSCLLNRDGRAFCFGNNTVFELGTTTTERCYGNKPCSRTPVAVNTSSTFVLLSTSMFATCGLTSTKTMLCWGMDYQSLFGTTATILACQASPGNRCTADPVPGPTGFVSLTTSDGTQCGIRDDGIGYCWGGNDNGQRGTPGSSPDPVPRVFSLAPKGTSP